MKLNFRKGLFYLEWKKLWSLKIQHRLKQVKLIVKSHEVTWENTALSPPSSFLKASFNVIAVVFFFFFFLIVIAVVFSNDRERLTACTKKISFMKVNVSEASKLVISCGNFPLI